MKWLGLLASIAIAGFCVYTAIYSATVRYRLTLYAEVHGEPKSGSGVIEVTYSKNNDPISQVEFFGANAKLVRATLEIVPAGIWPFSSYGITGEPITTGIENKLAWWNGPFPWLRPMGGGVFIDTRTETFKVDKEDFKRG